MTTLDTRFVIVGGGLAGLYAAHELARQGIDDPVLLEARDVLGGRIQSLSPEGPSLIGPRAVRNRFDLGPTWFWPSLQPELDKLVTQLGLERFKQFETGDMVLERSAHEKPFRTFGYSNSPASMRLVGGMAALVEALRSRLTCGQVILNRKVLELRCEGQRVTVVSVDEAGALHTIRAEHVLLAVPPRLALEHIRFAPGLPAPLARQWQATGTWMAPHAKYMAIYDTPFWREQGLSGEARSARGPLSEIHDASMPGGSAALFGFFGVPASVRRDVAEDILLDHCRAQLVRLFGPEAATPKVDFIKDWARDVLTAASADLATPAGHASAPDALASSGGWKGRIAGVGSEWSAQFPGYLAGAIEAARVGVQSILRAQAGTHWPSPRRTWSSVSAA